MILYLSGNLVRRLHGIQDLADLAGIPDGINLLHCLLQLPKEFVVASSSQGYDKRVIGQTLSIALVILVVFAIIAITKMPAASSGDRSLNVGPTLRRLLSNKRYLEGVSAQFFYVGAQIMCWTFIIHYATLELGMDEVTAQGYNIVAMVIFVTSRFICTFFLKYVSPGGLLMTLAIGGGALTFGTIVIQGIVGLYCLVGISACMSLMFPTIYGIALRGLGDDTKIAAAGLIMSILGGSVMPPLQGAIIDMETIGVGSFSVAAVRASFVLPLICFVVIAHYGWRTSVLHDRQ